ncbi:MAG: hypothetical protein LBI87_03715 [Candidatus Accumulibacter sp.]|jgi:hypothetical protein|nr:hypothetical protein [Accumulibacter sp.]
MMMAKETDGHGGIFEKAIDHGEKPMKNPCLSPRSSWLVFFAVADSRFSK